MLGKYYWKKNKLYKGLIPHKKPRGYDIEVVDSPYQSCIPLLFQWKTLVFLSFLAKQQPRLCISQWTMVYELLWPLSQLLVSVFRSKRGSPTNITIQVHLPHLPLITSDHKTLEATANSVGKCFHRANTNANMYVSSCISVQGILEAIVLYVDNKAHIQKLYYDHIPFKCMGFHEYGYFAKDFPLNMEILQKTSHCGGKQSMVDRNKD